MLDVLWTRNDATGRGFTEFGGAAGNGHGGFVPTGEPALFLLTGDDLAAQFAAARVFEGDQFLARNNVLHLAPVSLGESPLGGVLATSHEYLHRFTTGLERKPAFSADFPARLIRTRREWRHLVLSDATLDQLNEIKQWVLHGRTLLEDWGMRDKLGAGFTSLFHGAPGTGKTLSACLLGKHCGCDVYKVDLSMIVSKYIGETTVFDPEIPVNIYELGMIYDVTVDAGARVHVTMTLTCPACPSAQQLPVEVREKIRAIAGVREADVEVVWEPPWTMEQMSDVARLQLGLM